MLNLGSRNYYLAKGVSGCGLVARYWFSRPQGRKKGHRAGGGGGGGGGAGGAGQVYLFIYQSGISQVVLALLIWPGCLVVEG